MNKMYDYKLLNNMIKNSKIVSEMEKVNKKYTTITTGD